MKIRARLSLTFAVAGLLTVACLGSSAAAGHRRPKPRSGQVAFQTLVQRSIPGQQGDQVREVVRDAATWKDLWFSLRERDSGVLPHQQPAVDFEKSMVIVAAMPTQSCVSKVTIRGITHQSGALVVDLLEAPPAPNCVCIVSQRPIHAIAVPRSANPVRFVTTKGVTACGGRG
ncbi:MAG TPA: hypothetical protein VLX28_26460 [Thermoanaerobaculia bacterium]|nr:hypothetical protein [Thermoanaerobaculia bacterium]